MTEVKQLQEVNLEEFEAMKKEEQFNYELLDGDRRKFCVKENKELPDWE